MPHNWNAIKMEYIYGIQREDGTVHIPSLEDLAQRHKVGIASLRRHCAREGWVQERERAQEEIVQRVKDGLVKKVVHRLVAAYEHAIEGGIEYMQMGRAVLRPLSKFQSYLSGDARLDMKLIEVITRIGAGAQRMHGGGWDAVRSALHDIIGLTESQAGASYDMEMTVEEYTRRVLHVADSTVAKLIASEAPEAIVKEIVMNLVQERRSLLVSALREVTEDEEKENHAESAHTIE